MAADAWVFYDSFPELLGGGTIDLDNDTFKMALYLSSSNADNTSDNVYSSDLTNEHSAGGGYAAGGETLTSVTWNNVDGTVTFDCADVVWNASGGDITARYAVIYDDTPSPKPLVAYSLLDNTPADVTATDGNSLTIQIHESGIFTLS